MWQVNLDLREISKLEKVTLQKAKNIALPLAVKGTLNTLAFNTQKSAKLTIDKEFDTRNTFTKRSVRVDPVKTLKMSDMVSTTGSIASYMKDQEEGVRLSSKGEKGLRIPTGAAGGGKQLYPRKKTIKKRYRRGHLELANRQGRIKAKTKRQFVLMSIRMAALRGQSPFVFLGFGGKKSGIYQVVATGSPPPSRYKRGDKFFVRKNKWGKPKGKPGKEQLIFIHSHSKKIIVIPETRWLSKNALLRAEAMSIIFEGEADRVFKRFVK